MTGTNCDLFTYKSSRSYLNHLVHDFPSIVHSADLFRHQAVGQHEGTGGTF